MKFRQRRHYLSSGFRYDARFDTVDDSLDDKVFQLEVRLKLTTEENQDSSEPILVQSSKNVIPDVTEIYLSDTETDLCLDLSILSTDENEKLILNVPVEGSYKTYHLKLPAIKALQICRRLTDGEDFESTLEAAQSHYDEDRVGTCYSILQDASGCLSYEDYLAVRDTLIREEPRLEKTVERNRYASIRNMIMGRSKGTHFKIASASELWERVETYNEYANLKTIDETEVIKHILKSRYVENRTSGYPSIKLNEVKKVIFDPEFVERTSKIPEQYFAAYCADLLSQDSFEIARKLIETYVEPPESLDYETELQRLLDTDEITVYNEKAELFRQLLSEAARRDTQTFKFVAANYLFWRARDYSSRPDSEANLELQKMLFSTGGQLAEEVGGISFIREQAKYFEALTEGHLNKFEDHNKAAERYFDALAIAQDEKSTWFSSRYHYLIPPLRHRAESMANRFENIQEYAEGVKYLESQIELLRSWEDVDKNQREVAINRLEGLKLEHEAHELLQSEPVGDVIDKAKEKFGRASQHFDKAEAEELQAGALGRIKELEALDAEFEGEFEEAAQAHADYYKEHPNTRGTRYHKLAETTCLVKQHLIEGEIEKAKTKMEELKEESGNMTSSQQLLIVLVELLYDYQNETLTDYETVFGTVADTSTSEAHLLAVQTDYYIGISQILAAQRLRKTSSRGILDNLVEQSIRDALIPADIDQYSLDYIETNFTLQHASLGDWKKELPKNVYDKVWAIEKDQDSAVDYDNLVSGLFIAVERLLMTVVEYYCKREWGEDWKRELYDEIYEDPNYDSPITLDPLFRFFYHKPGESLQNVKKIQELDQAEIADKTSIKSMRNTIVHGNELRVANSWDEYEAIRESIYQLMKIILLVTPKVATIDRTLRTHVIFKILKKQPPNSIEIEYSGTLSEDQIYYLPPDIDKTDESKLAGSDIIRCEHPKGLNEFV